MALSTKEEFILSYCLRHYTSADEFKLRYVVLPCKCGKAGCEGWSVIENCPFAIFIYEQNQAMLK